MEKVCNLGSGTYGIVYKIAAGKGGPAYAFKRNLTQGNGFSEVMRELDILNRVRGHPLIVSIMMVSLGSPYLDEPMSPLKKCHEAFTDDVFHFLFELADSSLHGWLETQIPTFKQIKQFMVDILIGTEFIYHSGILHRDIKPANIVIFKPGSDPLSPTIPERNTTPMEFGLDGKEVPKTPAEYTGLYRAKICDFGLAKPYAPDNDGTPGVTTVWYRAPEVVGGHKTYDAKVDSWAVGCTFYDLIFRKPYIGRIADSRTEYVRNILREPLYTYSPHEVRSVLNYKGTLKEERPKSIRARIQENQYASYILKTHCVNYGDNYDDLVFNLENIFNSLLTIDPEKRKTVTEVLNLPFFDSHREYIEQFRTRFPPKLSMQYKYNIPNTKERIWASAYIRSIYNSRANYSLWYSHRRLFHAIDMFDRVLRYFIRKAPPNAIETETSGVALTKLETEIYFFSCLYISIKFFTSLQERVDITDFLPVHLRGLVDTRMKSVEAFIIKDIFEYSIYRHSIYEALHCLKEDSDGVSEALIQNALIRLTTLPSTVDGKNPTELALELIS